MRWPWRREARAIELRRAVSSIRAQELETARETWRRSSNLISDPLEAAVFSMLVEITKTIE